MLYISIILIVLIGYISYREYLSYKERGEFLSRIMAKDYHEFESWNAQKRIEKKVEKELKQEKSDIYIPPEEMTEEDIKKATAE